MKEADKKKQLKKHKAIATGLFVLMALVYGVMIYLLETHPKNWMGYVKAFSEAGMVGALADWFAVTALFRHPLGLPIPHTNLIEQKKDDLGQNLGQFVNENFLGSSTIRPYIERLDFAKIIVKWIEKPANKEGLEKEISLLAEKILNELNDKEVEDFLVQKVGDLLLNLNYQKLTSSGIEYLLSKNEHIHLLENFLPQIKKYVIENEALILKRLADSRPFIAFLAGKKISKEVTQGLVSFIEEIERDPSHFVRIKLTENLNNFSREILNSPEWEEKLNRLKKELNLTDKLMPYAEDAWQKIKESLRLQLEDPESNSHRFIRKNLDKISTNLKEDSRLQARINNWIRHFLYRMILKNRQEIEALIGSTVSGWEAKELSEKLELEVGKDLQFIRVNGTLVGGIVGLLIYLITHLFI